MILRQALVAVLAASAVAYVPRTATFGHRKKFGTAQRVAPRSRSTLVATIPVPVAETAKGADPAPLPLHPAVHLGQLDNGLSYAILPNRSPPGRFEVHLEVFAGSANENEDQQGMAHILEHIAYMGSRKRERLFGTGSQTNAYTDFHHTVFYAACPTYASTGPSAGGGSGPLGSIFKGLRGAQAGKDNKAPMLPLALDAVLDVLEARIEKGRLEQERAAVLSEMQMVNTMEYRVECQILSSLHNENILSERFPIGKENLIRSWTTDDVREYHQAHYRPDNAMLYVVGDVVAEEAEELIGKLFGHLEPSEARREGPLNLKAAQSKHFPPVTHEWTMQERPKNIALPDELLRDLSVTSSRDLVSRTKMFYHELLQGFSFHLFAKRPVEPVTSSEAFMRALAKRVAIAALQIRLNVNARSDPPFTYVEFNQLDSPREGAAVCSLDLMAEPSRWREAILVVVSEIRRFAEFGLTQNELERYLAAMLADSAQIRAQGDRISNADQLQYLMENTACGHTFMDPEQSHMATEAAVRSLTLEDVNSVAKEVCGHFLALAEDTQGELPLPASVVACVPAAEAAAGSGPDVPTLQDVVEAVEEAAALPIERQEEVVVPHTLMSKEQLAAAVASNPPVSSAPPLPQGFSEEDCGGVVMRSYGNGLKVNYRECDHESQRGHLRLQVSGGRALEDAYGPASVLVGARTMQEGGAVNGFGREQVELFCIDHLLMVEIVATEESVTFDFTFPTTCPDGSLRAPEGSQQVTGLEAVLQVVRCVLDGYVWEEDAFKRACQGFYQAYEASAKSLEGAATEALAEALTGGDKRFLTAAPKDIQSLDLETVRAAMMAQLRPDRAEVTLSGDFAAEELEGLVASYLGTIPAAPAAEQGGAAWPIDLPIKEDAASAARTIPVFLPDSEERAMAYVAGLCPNRWGVYPGGRSVTDDMEELHAAVEKRGVDQKTLQRWSHPLFAYTCLSLLQECVNRRLFSHVRETRRLTYDANAQLCQFDAIRGSLYLFSVTSSPDKVEAARDAVLETLGIMNDYYPISEDNLQSAKRVLLGRHAADSRTNRYWVDLMAGMQLDGIPKDVRCVTDVEDVIAGVTLKDLKLVFEVLHLQDNPVSVLAVSKPGA